MASQMARTIRAEWPLSEQELSFAVKCAMDDAEKALRDKAAQLARKWGSEGDWIDGRAKNFAEHVMCDERKRCAAELREAFNLAIE